MQLFVLLFILLCILLFRSLLFLSYRCLYQCCWVSLQALAGPTPMMMGSAPMMAPMTAPMAAMAPSVAALAGPNTVSTAAMAPGECPVMPHNKTSHSTGYGHHHCNTPPYVEGLCQGCNGPCETL